MFFHQIIGQEEIKERLRRSVELDQIPHAQLLCGGEGVGKFALALAYARYIHCTNRGTDDACGVCPSCRKYDELVHPDLHFVFPIYKSAKLKREICDDYLKDFREFIHKSGYLSYSSWMSFIESDNAQGLIYSNESAEIMRKINLKSYEAEYKIMIIWLPERLHESCANKILKLLEEPPAKTLFLLVSDQPDRVLLTIQSRSQRINVRNIELEKLKQALMSRFMLSSEDASSIAHYSGGNYLKAIDCLSTSEDSKLFYEHFITMMRMAYAIANMGGASNPSLKFDSLVKLKDISEMVASLGRERQRRFLGYSQQFLRENYIANLQTPELNYMNRDEATFASRFAPFLHERNIEEFMKEFELAEQHIESNVNPKMVFFDLALKMIVLFKK
ncbi:MAG: ATP-binding protein [Bacteroidales bacterium]